jgi:Gpi18-like mannosyltransferase
MSYEGVPILLFVYKIPFLILDLALAFLLLRFFGDDQKASWAFKLWCINPISIFITFAIGQYDIFPTFFTLLAFYFLKIDRPSWSALSLGIASIFKWFALPLLFPIAFIYSKQNAALISKTLAFLRICIIGFIPIIVGVFGSLIIPTYYESINAAFVGFEYYNGFFGSQLFIPWYRISSPLLANFSLFILDFSLGLQLFQEVEIYSVLIAYGLFFFASIFYERWTFSKVWKATLIFFLMYYAFSHFHAQWFLWGQPFLIMLFAEDTRLRKLFPFFTLLFFIYVFYWDNAITTALLIPVIPQAWLWPGPLSILNALGLPGIQVLNVFRSFLSSLCIFASLIVLRGFNKEPAGV